MNRSTTGSLATNRELHILNPICERRSDIYNHRLHLDRLRTSTPLIRNERPSHFPAVRENPKKRMMQADRAQEIDTENMILLHKMRSIFHHGTAASNSGGPRHVDIEPRSLNQERRRRELEKINRENLGIVQRIRSSKSSYSMHSHLQERQKTEDILRRISRHGMRRLDVFSPTSSSILLGSPSRSQASSRASTSHMASRSSLGTPMSRSRSHLPMPLPPMPTAGLDLHGGLGTYSALSSSVTLAEEAPKPEYGHALLASASAASLDLEELRPDPIRLVRPPPPKPLPPPGGRGAKAASSQSAMLSSSSSPALMQSSPPRGSLGPEPRFTRDPSLAAAAAGGSSVSDRREGAKVAKSVTLAKSPPKPAAAVATDMLLQITVGHDGSVELGLT